MNEEQAVWLCDGLDRLITVIRAEGTRSGGGVLTDGPFAETKELLTGGTRGPHAASESSIRLRQP